MAYQIECSEENGILLWIEAPCGIKQPLMRWADLEDVKRFAENIMGFYNHKRQEALREAVDGQAEYDASVAESLLRQVFSDGNNCCEDTG